MQTIFHLNKYPRQCQSQDVSGPCNLREKRSEFQSSFWNNFFIAIFRMHSIFRYTFIRKLFLVNFSRDSKI